MGKIKQHKPVKFFSAVAFNAEIDPEALLSAIEKIFGKIDLRSDIYSFSRFTDYYQKEMGENLKKLFIAFRILKEPEYLVDDKIKSNKLEKDYLQNGQRQVNIDPGYLTEAKIILATTKDYSHRIYLGKGIFGDLHLNFENGSFKKQPWTYPDYQQQQIIDFFNSLRMHYRESQVRIANGF